MPIKKSPAKTKKTVKPAKEKTAKVGLVKKAVESERVESADREAPVKLAPNTGQTNGIEKYYESIGRRKRAVARVRVYTKKSTDTNVPEDKALITVNDKLYYEYFKIPELQNIVEAPLKKLKSLNRFKATVKIFGGGIHSQADAIKFALSRALVLFDQNFSKKLRKSGYLTRDSREKERRKYGLKKARKAPQWAKR